MSKLFKSAVGVAVGCSVIAGSAFTHEIPETPCLEYAAEAELPNIDKGIGNLAISDFLDDANDINEPLTNKIIVTADNLYLRTHIAGLVKATLIHGDVVEIDDKFKDWAYVKTGDGLEGWVLLRAGDNSFTKEINFGNLGTTSVDVNSAQTEINHTELSYITWDDRMEGPWNYSFPGTVIGSEDYPAGIPLFRNIPYNFEANIDNADLFIPAGESNLGLRYLLGDTGWGMYQKKSTATTYSVNGERMEECESHTYWFFGPTDGFLLDDPDVAERFLKGKMAIPANYSTAGQ